MTIEKGQKTKKKNRSGQGRPTVMTEKVVLKLEDAFKLSLTDEEACLEVGITTTPFYDYCQKNPKWAKRKEVLKRTPNIQAKKNWIEELNGGNYASSKDWLERKAKDEFSTLVKNDNTNVNTEVEADSMTDEQRKLIADRFKG